MSGPAVEAPSAISQTWYKDGAASSLTRASLVIVSPGLRPARARLAFIVADTEPTSLSLLFMLSLLP